MFEGPRSRPFIGLLGWAVISLTGCEDRMTAAVRSDSGPESPSECAGAVQLSFVPDTGEAAEAYVCFGFDSGPLGDRNIARIAWTNSQPPFILHHGKLYAVPDDYSDGPTSCGGMPAGSVGLHVWALGGDDLVMPPDTGLVLPARTRRFVVEAHVVRVGTGTPTAAAVSLCPGPNFATNLAAMMPVFAPVPAIRPHHIETSEATCVVSGPVHLFSVWPHMHVIGTEIDLELVRGDGTVMPLASVSPWAFQAQMTYPLDVEARAGDTVRTRCTWQNNSDHYIFPGLLTTDEMCNAGFIAWPATAANCLVSAAD